MAEINNHQSLKISSQPSNVASSESGASEWSSNPAAVLTGIICFLIAERMKLQEQYSEMAQMEAKVQGQLGQASAEFIRQGATDQKWATMSQAIGTGLSGISSLGEVGATAKMNSVINDSVKVEQGKLNSLAELKEHTRLAAVQDPSKIAVGPQNLALRHNPHQAGVDALRTDVKESMNRMGLDEAKKAITSMSPQEHQQFSKHLDQTHKAQNKHVESLHSQIQKNDTQNPRYSQVAQQLVTGLTNSAHGSQTEKAGEEQAGQKLADTVGQMAASATDQAYRHMDDEKNLAFSFIQALRQTLSTFPQA